MATVNGAPRYVPPVQRWGLSILGRTLLMASGWWTLTGGDFRYWGLALALVAAATASTYVVVRPGHRRWHPIAMVRFVAFFAYQSLIGGIDVARRAFDPRMPINPAFVRHRLHTQSELSEVLIADTVSLLPGTVGVELHEGELTLHVLDTAMPVAETLAKLELHVAALLDEVPSSAPPEHPP